MQPQSAPRDVHARVPPARIASAHDDVVVVVIIVFVRVVVVVSRAFVRERVHVSAGEARWRWWR
jgi:hypothetical protein